MTRPMAEEIPPATETVASTKAGKAPPTNPATGTKATEVADTTDLVADRALIPVSGSG